MCQPNCTNSCDAFEAALQRWLDGVPAEQLPSLQQHAAACSHCAGLLDAAQRLLEGLALTPAPSLPVSQRERLASDAVRLVRQVRRRRLLVRLGAAGLAACLLIAATLLWQVEPQPPPLSEPPLIVQIQIDLPPMPANQDHQLAIVPLRQAVDELGSALTALARRTADEALDNTKSLLPEPSLPPILPGPAVAPKVVAAPMPFEPAVDSLAVARRGLLDGLEPMARSARRAAGLFSRTLATVTDLSDTNPEPNE